MTCQKISRTGITVLGYFRIIDCDQCDREHLAPPPPPEFYTSFAVPLMKSQSYKRQVQQRPMASNNWLSKTMWGPSIEQ